MGITTPRKSVATHKKAFHDFHILEKYEAGMVLVGSEVKSVRAGKLSIKESFAKMMGSELWLINCHIDPYKGACAFDTVDPIRNRKLLLQRKELKKLIGRVEEKGLTLIPLEAYLARGWVKLSIGVAKAKKNYDKRSDLREKDVAREIERGMKGFSQ